MSDDRLIAGRYRLGELVGRGGMADVFEGYDTRLGRTVAVKLLKSDLANDASFEAKFRQEAQASARMAHPTIVRVYDAGEEIHTDENGNQRKVPFIVMELVRGQLLRELIHQGGVSVERSVKFVSGILTALEVSHRAGVVHRDIKPANVMIGEGDTVKVMDFGIARAVTDNSATQAATMGIIGTAQYFSPEQARGEAVDGRTDLYSTGVILYELLAGRPPFRGESAVSVAYQHVSEAVTPPSAHNPQISAELDQVVLRALAKDKEQRFQTAEEFRENLLAAAAGNSIATAPKPVVNNAPAAVPTTAPVPPVAPTQVYSAAKTELHTSPTSLIDGFETAPSQEIRTEGKLNPGLIWGLAGGAVVIIAGLFFWLFTLGGLQGPSNTTGGISVVSVEGLTYDDAYKALTDQELLVLRVFEKSDTVEEGFVIRQEPAAGTAVVANTPITLYVSAGKDEIQIPNLVGMTEADAVANLQAMQLVVGTITVVESPTVPEGNVIATDPASGQKVVPGSTVNLVLSNGKVLVPDVRNLAVLEARNILTAPTIGYQVSIEVKDAASCTGTPGTVVLDQSITAGPAPQLQTIILYVECVGAPAN